MARMSSSGGGARRAEEEKEVFYCGVSYQKTETGNQLCIRCRAAPLGVRGKFQRGLKFKVLCLK